MTTDRTPKAVAEFVSEAQETIDLLGRELMHLEGGDPPPDAVNAVFRAAHSLKGLAAMFGVERMSRLAHALEDLLDDARMGRRRLERSALDLLLEVPEVLSRIIAEESAGEAPRTTDAAARLTDRLRAREAPLAADEGDPLDAVDLPREVRSVLTEYEEHRLRANVQKGVGLFRVRVSYDLASFDQELSALSARLKRIGEVVSTLPASDGRDPSAIAFALLVASQEARDVVQREAGTAAGVEPIARTGAPPGPAPADGTPAAAPARPLPERPAEAPRAEEAPSLRSVSQSVRVDIHKLDWLMNVVGELVLVKSSLQSIADRLKAQGGDASLTGELFHANRGLERRLAELQDGILEVRMVPLDQIFDKLARMVRKIAREVGKEVELEVSGGDVELDKLIVEDLSDPLMHLIRNSIDHAIEPPEARERAGKARVGHIRLSAQQKGNHVLIAVEDDGAGIDEDRIREVAVARGLA